MKVLVGVLAPTVIVIWVTVYSVVMAKKPDKPSHTPTNAASQRGVTTPAAAPTTVAKTAPTTVAKTEPTTVAKTEPTTVAKTAPTTVAKTAPTTVAKTEPTTVAKTEPVAKPKAQPKTVVKPTPKAQPTAKATPKPKVTPPAKPKVNYAAAARKIFFSRCVACHGSSGRGNGPAAGSLNPKPRNYTEVAWQRSVSNARIEKVIVHGGPSIGKSPLMPPNPDLASKPEVLKALRRIVRGFSGK